MRVIGKDEGRPQILPPRGRQAGVLPILQALVDAQPRRPGLPGTHLNAALATLRPLVKPGSLVLILSDFSAIDADTEALLAGIAARCDCRLLWLVDPLESSGLPAGSFRVGVPGRSWWLSGADSRPAWQAAWAQRADRLITLAQRLNLPLTRFETTAAIEDVLPPLLRERTWRT